MTLEKFLTEIGLELTSEQRLAISERLDLELICVGCDMEIEEVKIELESGEIYLDTN